jgi:hypothetical protein
MASSNRKVMNLNSLLKGADDKLDKPKVRPTSAFGKPSMSKLAAFDTVKTPKIEESKEPSVIKTNQSNNNKISELIDKANETRNEENKEEILKKPLMEAEMIRRPQTANAGSRKVSSFSKNNFVKEDDDSTGSGKDGSGSSSGCSSDVSSNSSENDSDEGAPVSYNKKISMLGFKSQNIKRGGKKGNRNTSNKYIGTESPKGPFAVPLSHRKSILVTGGKSPNGEYHMVIQPFVERNPSQKDIQIQQTSTIKYPKRGNVQMTPSQSLGNDRKLMPIGVAGLPLSKGKVKEEHHAQNMKPSSDFFSFDVLNYPHLIKTNLQTSKIWNKSFAEAINDIKIEYKEQLYKIDQKFKRRFARRNCCAKKTIVFGLDQVLVKTSFEKESDEFKPATLLLDETTGATIKIFVSVRPYVVNTLKQLKRANYELILYSTSQFNYTNAILEVLTKDHKIDFQHIITSEDHEEALKSCPNPLQKIVNSKNINLLTYDRKERDIIFVD